jgi:hypothetical protein
MPTPLETTLAWLLAPSAFVTAEIWPAPELRPQPHTALYAFNAVDAEDLTVKQVSAQSLTRDSQGHTDRGKKTDRILIAPPCMHHAAVILLPVDLITTG